MGKLVVRFACSYDGLPAKNAAKFCDWLNMLSSGALNGVPFVVFACGMWILKSVSRIWPLPITDKKNREICYSKPFAPDKVQVFSGYFQGLALTWLGYELQRLTTTTAALTSGDRQIVQMISAHR